MRNTDLSVSIDSKTKYQPEFSSKPKWFLKYSSQLNFLLGILYWIGLLTDSGKREIIVFVFFAFSIAINADCLKLLVKAHAGGFYDRISLLHSACFMLSSVTWYLFRRKKKYMSKLLIALKQVHPFSLTKFQIFLLVFIFVTFIALSILHVLQQLERGYPLLMYGYKLNNHYIGMIFHFIKIFLAFFLHPMWANFSLLLYCILCKCIAGLLHQVTRVIQSYSPQSFTVERQMEILRRQSEIVDIIHFMQAVFSTPTFMISIAHFINCIAVLAIIASIFSTEGFSVMFTQWILMLANSSGGLLVGLWTAGEIPLEAGLLAEAFRKKMRQRLVFVGKEDEFCVEKQLPKKSSFVLSGCDIIYFRRSSILALSGTILTYTVLIITKL